MAKMLIILHWEALGGKRDLKMSDLLSFQK